MAQVLGSPFYICGLNFKKWWPCHSILHCFGTVERLQSLTHILWWLNDVLHKNLVTRKYCTSIKKFYKIYIWKTYDWLCAWMVCRKCNAFCTSSIWTDWEEIGRLQDDEFYIYSRFFFLNNPTNFQFVIYQLYFVQFDTRCFEFIVHCLKYYMPACMASKMSQLKKEILL